MAAHAESVSRVVSLADRYRRVRSASESLVATLAPEDTVVQSMPDVSPSKWHLAHTSWFFERFVLEAAAPGYTRFDERYDFLFNSYYRVVHTDARRWPRYSTTALTSTNTCCTCSKTATTRRRRSSISG